MVSRDDVVIRRGRGGDEAALLSLWRAAVEATHDFLTEEDVDWYAEVVAGYLPAMNDIRVAEDARGIPLGFIAQDDGEIHMLFVDPAVHGRGVGTKLLNDVGSTFPVLRVDVNERNTSGRAFYYARGFEQAGRSEIDGQGRPFPLLHLQRTCSTAM